MTKLQKIIFGLVTAITVMLLFSVASIMKAPSNLGGVYNQVTSDFPEGITVDGTTRISGTGAITATTLTTTSTASLGVVGSGANITAPIVAPAADTTLTVAQSGAIVQMAVAGLDVTLPAATAAAGVGYRFVVSAAVASTDMTIVGAAADLINGTLVVAGAVVDCYASDIITFVIDGENVGDFVELYSDGTSWLIGDSGALTASKMTCSG